MAQGVKEEEKTLVYRTRLLELRKAKGLTRMDIVRDAIISNSTAIKLENDPLGSVKAEHIQVLCKILDCEPEELVYLSEE